MLSFREMRLNHPPASSLLNVAVVVEVVVLGGVAAVCSGDVPRLGSSTCLGAAVGVIGTISTCEIKSHLQWTRYCSTDPFAMLIHFLSAGSSVPMRGGNMMAMSRAIYVCLARWTGAAQTWHPFQIRSQMRREAEDKSLHVLVGLILYCKLRITLLQNERMVALIR